MKLSETGIDGCFVVEGAPFADARGVFAKPFTCDALAEVGVEFDLAELFWSRSIAGTIRGMHFQIPPVPAAKLVWCSMGSVLDAVVDLRRDSPSCGATITTQLGDGGAMGIVVPIGCAHGFAVRDGVALVSYATSGPYLQELDLGVHVDSIGIEWGITDPVLSSRDAGFPALADYVSPF
jgi:dTDP-4-dehydrorhamnose 3,5-epimerase